MQSKLADGVRFGADGVDAGVGAAAVGQFLDALVNVLLHEIDGDGAGVTGHLQALGHGVDGDDALGAQQEGAADAELGDGAAAEDGDGLTAFDLAELGAHVAVGKMSERNRACSSLMPSGTLTGPTSAKGTRRYSAWPPGMPPSRWE